MATAVGGLGKMCHDILQSVDDVKLKSRTEMVEENKR